MGITILIYRKYQFLVIILFTLILISFFIIEYYGNVELNGYYKKFLLLGLPLFSLVFF